MARMLILISPGPLWAGFSFARLRVGCAGRDSSDLPTPLVRARDESVSLTASVAGLKTRTMRRTTIGLML